MAGKPYNGHKNWAHWNVALWIANDEPLYRRAKAIVATSANRDRAVERLMAELPEKTPDGAVYSKSAVRAALVDL
jgi:hypothetical protein